MSLIGSDFRDGLRVPLYRREPVPSLWPSIAFFVVLAIVNQLLQAALTIGITTLSGHDFSDRASLLRAAMLAVLPAGLLTVGLAWLFAGRRGADARQMLRLRMPALGSLGWAAVIVAFLIAMYLMIAIFVAALNISPDNVGDVENAMKALVRDPSYPLIMIGIILGAPLAEELTFRGQIFAALAGTRLGYSGTTVLTSATWAGLHIGEPAHAVALIFIMGLALGFLLVRFGSLWVCFVCHAVWNGIYGMALLLAAPA